jgi:hypothetical protein
MARRALIVADNYPGTSAQLSGCLNDGLHMQALLRDQEFDDITTLLDSQATKAAIKRELDRLVDSLTGRDLGVFYDSGHGTEGSISLTPGAPAVKHEGIVPYDYRQAGIIWDQHVRDTLGRIEREARMVVILDTCFSGGMYRFAPPLTDYYRAVRFLPPDEWLRDVDVEAEVEAAEAGGEEFADRDAERQYVLDEIAAVAGQRVEKAYPVLLLAASQAGQVAWCADINGVPQGAFTYALLEVLAGRGRAGRQQRLPRHYLEWMYGAKDLHGVVTVRANRPGLLPSSDLADQDPTLHGTPGRVTWPILQA